MRVRKLVKLVLLQKTIQSNGYSAATRCGHEIHHVVVHPCDTAPELCARTAVMDLLFCLSLARRTCVHGLERGSKNTIEATAYHAAEKCQEGISASDLRKPSPAQKRTPEGHAPRADAANPKSVTPPEVPGATGLPFVIKRGDAALSVPSSVAQVSAVAVASAPMKPIFALRRVPGDREKP